MPTTEDAEKALVIVILPQPSLVDQFERVRKIGLEAADISFSFHTSS